MHCRKMSYAYSLIVCMLNKRFYSSYIGKTDRILVAGGRSVPTKDGLLLFLIKSVFLTTLLGA
jgi:hypothetical protein